MRNYLDRSLSYNEYLALIDSVLAEGRTTGPIQTEEKTEFTKLNRRRIERLGKTIRLSPEAFEVARSNDRPMIWLTISEAWCGDGAQNSPVIEKFAAESDNIQTRYILRDENLDLMDDFLTEGARSIPKLIALDASDLSVLFTWGPRPEAAKQYFAEMKANGVEKSAIAENLQRWYNADKGQAVIGELARLVIGLNGAKVKSAAS